MQYTKAIIILENQVAFDEGLRFRGNNSQYWQVIYFTLFTTLALQIKKKQK